MKTIRTKAIVLRRTNYGEADRIVQFITPEGRRSVMARGVRREKSKLAGGIELFAVSDVVIGEGKGELGVLTSAKLESFYRNILKDYERLQFGYEAVRLVARASEMIDEPEWFEVLAEVMAGLDVLTIPLPLIKVWFYGRYSSLLGHELNLQLDSEGAPLRADATYRYDSAEQGLREVTGGEIGGDHIKALRLITTRPLAVLVQVSGIAAVLPDALRVVEQHVAVDIA